MFTQENIEISLLFFMFFVRMVAGEEYTVSLTLTPMEEYAGLTVRTSDGDKTLATIDLSGTGRQTVQATFIAEYASGKSPDDEPDNADVLIYRKPASAGTASTIIHQIKLEKGNLATDWTAAPEDAEEVLEQKLSSVRRRSARRRTASAQRFRLPTRWPAT